MRAARCVRTILLTGLCTGCKDLAGAWLVRGAAVVGSILKAIPQLSNIRRALEAAFPQLSTQCKLLSNVAPAYTIQQTFKLCIRLLGQACLNLHVHESWTLNAECSWSVPTTPPVRTELLFRWGRAKMGEIHEGTRIIIGFMV